MQNTSAKEIFQAGLTAVRTAPELAHVGYEPVLPMPDSDAALSPILANSGSGDARNVTATLTTGDSFVSILTGSATYDTIRAGSQQGPQTGFRIHVRADCPDPHLVYLNLSVTADGFAASESFPLNITAHPGLSDGMESGENGWIHSGANDYWHQTEHRSHTASHSWYCGQEGTWQYANNSSARLETPFFTIGDDQGVGFWHWYSTEDG